MAQKGYNKCRLGYTAIELMVTIVIVVILCTTLGVGFARLLTIREAERDEAYVREKLNAIAGMCADYMSVGSGVMTVTNFFNGSVKSVTSYPMEVGGVSVETGGYYETGSVVRVACMTTTIDSVTKTLDLDIYSMNFWGDLTNRYSRMVRGDALLRLLTNNMVGCTFNLLKTNNAECSSLGVLTLSADYMGKDDVGDDILKTTKVERIIRLWNAK